MKKIYAIFTLLIVTVITSSVALAANTGGKDNWLSKEEFRHFIRKEIFNNVKLASIEISESGDSNYITAQVQEANPQRTHYMLVYSRLVPPNGKPVRVHYQSYDNPHPRIYNESDTNTCFVIGGTLRFYSQDYPDSLVTYDELGRISDILLSQHARHSAELSFSYHKDTNWVASASYYYGPAAIRHNYTFYEDGNIKSSDIDIGHGWSYEHTDYTYRYYDKKDWLVKKAERTTLKYSAGILASKSINKKHFDKNGQLISEYDTIIYYDQDGNITKEIRKERGLLTEDADLTEEELITDESTVSGDQEVLLRDALIGEQQAQMGKISGGSPTHSKVKMFPSLYDELKPPGLYSELKR